VIHRLWGSPEAVFLVYAGGAAELAALTAVDWLLFTNRVPAAPLERCFDIVRLAQQVFSGTPTQAVATIATSNRIPCHVEAARAMPIPEWAYRYVQGHRKRDRIDPDKWLADTVLRKRKVEISIRNQGGSDAKEAWEP
jgi:hypothetical protein